MFYFRSTAFPDLTAASRLEYVRAGQNFTITCSSQKEIELFKKIIWSGLKMGDALIYRCQVNTKTFPLDIYSLRILARNNQEDTNARDTSEWCQRFHLSWI